jgi:hypothetical protein
MCGESELYGGGGRENFGHCCGGVKLGGEVEREDRSGAELRRATRRET